MSVPVEPILPASPTVPNAFPQVLDQVEKDLMDHIIENIKTQKIRINDGRKLAREFLDLLPFADKADLLQKLNELGHTYLPAKEVYVDLNASIEEEKRQNLLVKMRDHIKNGNIEQAIAVAKGA